MKKIYTLLVLFCIAMQSIGQVAIDPKGTKFLVDSSKWKISGSNIYSKNTGNIGIGTTAPAYKLDVTATANPIRLMGVQNGSNSDSVLTIINGVVKKIAAAAFNQNDSTTANNGLTLTGKNIQLGGSLTQSTIINNNSNALTFATGGSAFNITGLTAGASTDSILTVNATTGKIGRISAATTTTVSNTNTAPNTLTTTVNGVTGTGVPIVNAVSNTSSANTLRTTVNGITGSTVNIINTNTLTQNGSNQFVSTINGVAATALTANITGDVTGNLGTSTVSKINGSPLGTTTGASNGQVLTWNGSAWVPATVSTPTTVSNSNTAPNSLTTTVNGVTGSAVPIVNSISNNLSGNTLTTTVNGVTGAGINLAGIIPATTNNLTLSGNTLTSTVNGITATSNSVSAVTSTSSGNNLTTAVNGVTGTTVPIVNSISNTSAANTLSTSVNGVTGNSVAIINSIANTSSGNNLSTSVNGISGTSVPIVNSISNNLSGNNLTTTVNGVTSTAVNLAGIIPATTHTLSLSGNTITSTVNGVAANSNSVSAVSNTSSGNNLTTTVNGVTGTTVPIVNTVVNSSSANTLTTTVNGVTSSSVPLVNSVSNNLSGNNLTTTVNGVTGSAINLAGIIPATTHTLSLSGNTITSTVNGIAATGNSVSTVSNTSTNNSLTTTVNGVAGSAVNIINANALTLSNGALTSTVNGVASSPAVNVIAAANNGLTASNGTVQLGGSLSQATAINTSATNTLSLTGLQNGVSTDSLLVVSTGVIKKIAAPQSFPQLLLDARRTTAYAPGSSYSTLIYNTASINTGTAYNTTTGIFTAPATGLYEIIINNGYNWAAVNSQLVNQIVVNGTVDMEKIISSYPTVATTNTTVSGNTIVSMTAGQTASITVGGEIGTATPLVGAGQHVLKIIRLQ